MLKFYITHDKHITQIVTSGETYMKIVICDDSIEDLLKIEKILLKYKKFYPNIDFEVEKFSNASQLYNNIQKNELADIYILDIIMSGKDGIDIGQQIRKSSADNIIIYTTCSGDYALEAYDLHAVRYILKPVNENRIFEALDYALSYKNAGKEASFLIKTREGLVQIPYSQIEYIENSSRTLEAHLTNSKIIKSIFIRKSFEEEISELIEDPMFIQVHKSLIINLKYIRKLAKNNVIMESGKNIPVSQKRAAVVKKEYLSFFSDYY